MYDCHVHSNFSLDSKMPQEAAIMKAIEIGLDGIAFTDHLDCDYPGYCFNIDFEKYEASVDSAIEQYRNKLKIIKGIEIGIQPHIIQDTNEILKGKKFDFIIGSVHIIDGRDPYVEGYYDSQEMLDVYRRYLEEIYFMITHFDDFDVLGHIDYIARYACYPVRSLRYDDYKEIVDSILKLLVQSNKGLELNTRTYIPKLGRSDCSPDIDIYKRFKEVGGKIVCLGSDSHQVDYIGYRFEEFSEFLKEAGFKYTTYFTDRTPHFVPID
ncbi:MAG: histidinol-phosphatase HisJ family protein [Eubacteriales bacterium]|nr:histidinol-phosphatase HisJ family protein [Eubacteriales bacterium]